MPYTEATRERFRNDPSDPKHGTLTGASALHCTCPRCTRAATEHRAAWVAARKAGPVPDEHVHGNTSGLKVWGCHHPDCLAAWRRAENGRRRRALDVEAALQITRNRETTAKEIPR